MATDEFGQPQDFISPQPNGTPNLGGDTGDVPRDLFGNPLSQGPQAMMNYDALFAGGEQGIENGSSGAGGTGAPEVPANRFIQPVYGDELITHIPPIDMAIDNIARADDAIEKLGGKIAEKAAPILQELGEEVVAWSQEWGGKAADSWSDPSNQLRAGLEEKLANFKDRLADLAQSDLVQGASQAGKTAFEALKNTQYAFGLLQRVAAPFAEGALEVASGANLASSRQDSFTLPADAKSFQDTYYTWQPYTIRSGDMLSQLAVDTMGTGSKAAYDFIAQHNGIQNPDKIYPGQEILIPVAVAMPSEVTPAAAANLGSEQINGFLLKDEFLAAANTWNLGAPASDVIAHSSGATFQYFEHPELGRVSVVSSDHGAFPLWGGIRNHYVNVAKGLNGALGAPTSPEQGVGNGLVKQEFENGYITWKDGVAQAYNQDGGLLFQRPAYTPPSSGASGVGGDRSYSGELANLSSDEWDVYSSDNTRFDGALWGGEKDERHLTPESIKQVYDDLSVALFGDRYKMTAGYLNDQSYFNGSGKWHAGIDIDAPDGAPVKAITGGEVAWVWEGGDRGDFIAIKGDDGKEWVYGHLQDKSGFYKGKRVDSGDVVGIVGNQRNASHLHLEVKVGSGSTGGAHRDQSFLKQVTMSPLQAFWELQPKGLQPEAKGSYEESFDARIYEEGSDTPISTNPTIEKPVAPQKPKAQEPEKADYEAIILQDSLDLQFKLDDMGLWGKGGKGISGDFDWRFDNIGFNESFGPGKAWLNMKGGVGAFISSGTFDLNLPGAFDFSYQDDMLTISSALGKGDSLFSSYLGAGLGIDFELSTGLGINDDIPVFGGTNFNFKSGIELDGADVLLGALAPAMAKAVDLDTGIRIVDRNFEDNTLKGNDDLGVKLSLTDALLKGQKWGDLKLEDFLSLDLGAYLNQESSVELKGFDFDHNGDGISDFSVDMNESTSIPLPAVGLENLKIQPIVDLTTKFSFKIMGEGAASYQNVIDSTIPDSTPQWIKEMLKVNVAGFNFEPQQSFKISEFTFDPFEESGSWSDFKVA
jgi:murein DD-endopeptidase MepM/ murein hydrolase activator NlpD/uncharacterized protein YukE